MRHFLLSALGTLLLCFNDSLYAQPVITSLSPQSGDAGSSLIINGSGFNPIPANNIVYFGSAKGSVTSASASSLTVTVPTGFIPGPVSITTGGLTAYSTSPFTVTFPNGGAFTSGSFHPNINIPAANVPYSVVAGDLNDDNKPEMIVANFLNNSVSVYTNACSASTLDFSVRTDITTGGTTCGTAVVGDLDGDGKLDIITGNTGSPVYSLSLFRNTSTSGSISFAPKIDFIVPNEPYSIVIADMDADGKPEIICTNRSDIYIFKNTSSPGVVTFNGPSIFFAGTFVTGLTIADINANGKPDVLTCSSSPSTVIVLSNTSTTGNVSLAAPVTFTTAFSPVDVTAGDLDGDNKPEMVVVNNSSNSVSVFRNTGTGNSVSFAPKQDFATGSSPWDVELGDLNGDGKLDIVVGIHSVARQISVFRNTSSGSISFDARVNYSTPQDIWRFALADFRNIARLDIAAVCPSNYAVSVYRNKISDPPIITSFSPATAGEGTNITINGSNLASVTSASFGGVPATSISIFSDNLMSARVGIGASGNVSVTSAAGTASLAGFTFIGRPQITSFQPQQGPVGQMVKITGSNFSSIPAENIVFFGGVKAVVNSASPTVLKVTVPAGAKYQPISVTVNGLTSWSKLPFRITFPDGTLNMTTLSKGIEYPASLNAGLRGVVMGDIDLDGKNDMAVSNYGSGGNSISVYRNTSVNGIASFAPKVDFAVTGTHPVNVNLTDFNGDGKLDVAAPCDWSGTLAVLRNTSVPGTISFATSQAFSGGGFTDQICTSDLDGDGRPDMVSTGVSAISIHRNTSTIAAISFANRQLLATELSYLAIADMDGDNKPDLLTTTSSDHAVLLFRNTSLPGTIIFAPAVQYFAGANTSYLTIGDMDGDNQQDIVVRGGSYMGAPSYDSVITIFRNLSTPGNFAFAPSAEFKTRPCISIGLCDLDGDGWMDILTQSNTDTNIYKIAVLKNLSTAGNLSFSSVIHNISAINRYPKHFDCGDLDGDGKPDVGIVYYNIGEYTTYYLNQNGSDREFCPGGTDSLYSNITGGFYQWQIQRPDSAYRNLIDDMTHTGSSTIKLKLSNLSSSWYGTKYRCIVNTGISRVITIKFVNKWTGAINSDWENPGNWSCGVLPDANTDVIINSGTIIINSNVTIRSLYLNPDVNFSVSSSYTLTILH